MTPKPLTRRGFLIATVAAAAAACGNDSSNQGGGPTTTAPSGPTTTTTPGSTTAVATTTTLPAIELPGDPFTLGVASGDPLSDSVILWTRLAPDPQAGGGMPDEAVDVDWEIATDETFTDVIGGGTAAALPQLGHSVHVDADGLAPDTIYWYRFSVGGYVSSVGRTRTFAAAGTTPDRLRFAFSSCQNWQGGHYAAYRDLVDDGDIDAFVFLGDYIYEYADGGYSVDGGRTLGGAAEVETVEDYRNRYALYKSDSHLRSAHELAPWIITWDDHEVDNDYAGSTSEDDATEAEFLERRAAAYQAWYEHLPVRLEAPEGADYEIHRTLDHGDLVRFYVLDGRQYRSDQQRGGPELGVEAIGAAVQQLIPESSAPERTMLGADQEAWLLDAASSSGAVWDCLAQQVFMFGANVFPGSDPPFVVVDTWDGYPVARERLLQGLGDETAVENLVVLTGDFHSAAVAELRVDWTDVTTPPIGVELMASSISSQFFDGAEELASTAVALNPHIVAYDTRRGYTVCEVTPTTWTAEYRAVDDPADAQSTISIAGIYQITAGTPGVIPVNP